MTKQEMIAQINRVFDNLFISKPATKREMLNKINETFDKLLISVD